jgi:hypothetical protein
MLGIIIGIAAIIAIVSTIEGTNQQIKEMQAEAASVESTIIGPDVLSPYDENIVYKAINADGAWEVSLTSAAAGSIDDYISYSIDDNNNLIINVTTTKAYRKGFNIIYGDLIKHVTIKSL